MLARANIATTPDFSLETFYAPLDSIANFSHLRKHKSKCMRENGLVVFLCPKIPLLIDPLGHGEEVMLFGASEAKRKEMLLRYSTSRFSSVQDFLQDACRQDTPVLFEHAEEVIAEILSVLRTRPDLLPQTRSMYNTMCPHAHGMDEVSGAEDMTVSRLYQGYCIVLSTCKKTYVPPADAFLYMSLCDLTPDSNAMAEYSLESILQHLDEEVLLGRSQYWSMNYALKDAVRKMSRAWTTRLVMQDLIARITEDNTDDYAQDCHELMECRGKLQRHALQTYQTLRAAEYYDGLAQMCGAMLSASWDVCALARVNFFGRGLLVNALAKCSPISNLQQGSPAFQSRIVEIADFVLSKMTAAMLLALPSETHHLCIMLLHSSGCLQNPKQQKAMKWKGALQFLSEVFNREGFALSNSQVVCSRGKTFAAKMFSTFSWKVFRESRPHLDEVYQMVLEHMDLREDEWKLFLNTSDVTTCLPCVTHPEDSDSDRSLIVTLTLRPHKFSEVLKQMTEDDLKSAKWHMLEDMKDSAQITNVEGQVEVFKNRCPLVSIVVGRGVLHWHAVQQVMLTFAFQRDGGSILGNQTLCEGMLRSLFVDQFTTDEELGQILHDASTSSCWVVMKFPSNGFGEWYKKIVRRITSFAAAAPGSAVGSGLLGRSRICIALDEDGDLKSSGLFCDSTVFMCQNWTDPSQLFRVIIADNAFTGQTPCKSYWRLVVGLCYMHAVLVADLKTTASCALFAGPPVTLQPLVDTARQLSRFQRLPAGQLLRLTRLFVCNLSYEALFSHPNPHLLDLLDACLSPGLFRNADQLIVLNQVLDSPDTSVDAGLKRLYDYSYCLCTTVRAPWHGEVPDCLLVDAQFESAICSTTLLERTKLHKACLHDHSGVIVLAESLMNLLPASDIVCFESPVIHRFIQFFEQTFRTMCLNEFNQVQKRLQRVKADLEQLLMACKGRQAFDDYSYALYRAIDNNQIVQWWDEFASTAKSPVRWYIEDLTTKFHYFHSKLCEFGMSRGGQTRAKASTPLHAWTRPKELLELYILAWQHSSSKSLSASISLPPSRIVFAAFSALPAGERKMKEFPMEKGIIISDLVFRCVKYTAATMSLSALAAGSHTFGDGAVDALCLQPVDLAALPARADMKAKGQYWVPIPVYRRPLCYQAWKGDRTERDAELGLGFRHGNDFTDNPSEAPSSRGRTQQLEFVFEAYFRSTVEPSQLQRMGACAYLHTGLQERALTYNWSKR